MNYTKSLYTFNYTVRRCIVYCIVQINRIYRLGNIQNSLPAKLSSHCFLQLTQTYPCVAKQEVLQSPCQHIYRAVAYYRRKDWKTVGLTLDLFSNYGIGLVYPWSWNISPQGPYSYHGVFYKCLKGPTSYNLNLEELE